MPKGILEMVKKGKYYKCEECGFLYKEIKWAEKCEEWCRKNHRCNIEIEWVN